MTTMTEYIAREKVLSKAAPVAGCFSNMISAYDVIMLPAADVAPVRHGRWLCGDYYDIGDVCSECDWDSQMTHPSYRYCPNCGAKMDKEE
mgnify:CR=1 FL=1